MSQFDLSKFSKYINRISPITFAAIGVIFMLGIWQADNCGDGWQSCGRLFMLVIGLLAVQGLYLIRPWLKVREKILSMAIELKLLDRIPKLRRDMSLEEAAESVIATLSQLQDDARATTQAMKELQQSQTDLLESLPEPVMVLDGDLHIIRANDSARRMFPDLLIGKTITTLFRDPELLSACQAALSDGGEHSIEFKFPLPVERVFQARTKAIPLRAFAIAEHKPALLLSLIDITAIKRTEQMRADFVANVSHEMRTPLASLIGFVETLLGPASNDLAAQKNFLKIMETQAKNMARLVDDLLSLSRIEMREHHLPDDLVEIEPILNNIALALQMQVAEKSMRIEIRCDDNLPPIRGDADELFQVFSNLVTNAVRYGYAKTPITITATKTDLLPPLFPSPDQPALLITVEDQGIGIPARHIPRLTERFYRVDKARSRQVGGTGLGLAIVKHILNRHRGAMVIESQENIGSKFLIYLPIVQTI